MKTDDSLVCAIFQQRVRKSVDMWVNNIEPGKGGYQQ